MDNFHHIKSNINFKGKTTSDFLAIKKRFPIPTLENHLNKTIEDVDVFSIEYVNKTKHAFFPCTNSSGNNKSDTADESIKPRTNGKL
jgi:hypothetical protein